MTLLNKENKQTASSLKAQVIFKEHSFEKVKLNLLKGVELVPGNA
jgi:hypothetical protein